MRECPKCHGLLEDDGTCSCGYGVKRRADRQQQQQISSVPILCSFNDQGRGCQCRGIISSTTNGSGQWFCREHWETVHGREPGCLGNAPWPIPKRPTVQPHVKPRSAGTLRPMVDWQEGEDYRAFRERVRETHAARGEQPREPGADDDLVPEEAGQA